MMKPLLRMNSPPFLLLAGCDAHSPLLSVPLSLSFRLSSQLHWALADVSGISLTLCSAAQRGQPHFPIFLPPLAVWQYNAFRVCLQFSVYNATLNSPEILQHAETCDKKHLLPHRFGAVETPWVLQHCFSWIVKINKFINYLVLRIFKLWLILF